MHEAELSLLFVRPLNAPKLGAFLEPQGRSIGYSYPRFHGEETRQLYGQVITCLRRTNRGSPGEEVEGPGETQKAREYRDA